MAKLLMTGYKSKILKFKLGEDILQCRIYFLTFMESLEMIFSQYKEICEVLLYCPTILGKDIKYYVSKAIKNILHANIDVQSRRLVAKIPADGVKFISKLQSHCANMTFSDKSKYDRIFQKVTHKLGESAMNYINIFHNEQALSVLVGNSYSEDQFMHILLDNFHQNGKYIAQIPSHQAELRREEIFTDQKYFSVTSLKTDYLHPDRSSGSGIKNERENLVQKKFTFCGCTDRSAEQCFKGIRKDKE